LSDWSFLKNTISPGDFTIDCRSQGSFEEGTIKGAYYFPFIKKAYGSDPESDKKVLTHMKGVLDKIEAENKSTVVVFDEGMGMFASKMVYLLRAIGLKEVYLFAKKFSFEMDLEPGTKIFDFEPSEKIPASFKVAGVVNKSFMEKNLTRLQIFDTRTKEEYDGKIPRMTNPEPGTLCGRLPGAFLWDWRSFYDSEGNVVDRNLFIKRLQSFPFMPERTTVLYDYNGARSCLPALMLKEVGYQDVHTYQGSWFEWRRSSLPKQAVSLFGTETKTTSAPRVGGTDRKKI
jgi:thiosulfate/3-mercaptopyruvate sulfurtransferase